MIDPMKAKQTLKGAELQDGDIICFQRTSERKVDAASATNKPLQEPYAPQRVQSCPHELTFGRIHRLSDRFEDAREYYDFLENKRVVRFVAHLSERVGAHLGVPSTHIRFWTVNGATDKPKVPVRRTTNPSLRQILQPTGVISTNQRSDAFYLEILDISLAEFDTKKLVKLIWLSEGITKEVSKLHGAFPDSEPG